MSDKIYIGTEVKGGQKGFRIVIVVIVTKAFSQKRPLRDVKKGRKLVGQGQTLLKEDLARERKMNKKK